MTLEFRVPPLLLLVMIETSVRFKKRYAMAVGSTAFLRVNEPLV